MKFYKKLEKLGACPGAVEWSKQFTSLQKAWDKCERGHWMLWLLGMKCNNINQRKMLVFTACQCARLSLKYVKKGEKRPLKAIQTAEKWAKDDSSVMLEDVQSDAAAYAAAYADAAAAYAAGAAAYAAGYAAAYAVAAADAAAAADADAAADAAAAAAADAAAAAAYAADAAAAARSKTLKKCADIIRKYYPKPPRL